MSIPKAWQKRIDKAAETVKDGDLYKALHYVGDDTAKMEIEEVLQEILDPETFRRIVAVFKIATTD